MATIIGTDGADRLTPTADADLIRGLGGDDTIVAAGGLDTVFGGAGDDRITANHWQDPAAQLLNGGDGDDWLTGELGDTLNGGAGRDQLILDLSAGDDAVTLDLNGLAWSRVRIHSGGVLTVVAGFETGVVLLTNHDDVARNGDATVALDGGQGDDTLLLDASGTLEGGAGDDRLTGSGGADLLMDQGSETADLVRGRGGDDAIDETGGRDTLLGGAGDDDIISYVPASALISGGGGDDRISVSHGEGTLLGGRGDDHISASAFAGGVLDGGAGDDTVSIGLSVFGPPADVLVRVGANGAIHVGDVITIRNAETADVYFGLGNDRVTLGDGRLISISGGVGDDLLVCGRGGDTLSGDYGEDTLVAGDGDDVLAGSHGRDTVSYAGAHGAVQVDLSIATPQATLGSGVDQLSGFEAVIGSAYDDTLAGGSGGDPLDGGAGDLLAGGDGDDRLTGGGGPDTLEGGAGGDTFVFGKLGDSAPKAADLIADLSDADWIDLHAMDADAGQDGDQAFVLVDAFDRTAGEAVLAYSRRTGETTLKLDVDGDAKADAVIVLAGHHDGFTNFVL